MKACDSNIQSAPHDGDKKEVTSPSKDNNELLNDYTNEFTTHEIFNGRGDMIEWVRRIGKRLRFVIIITKSEEGVNGKSPRLCFGCERGGVYRGKKTTERDASRRSTGTKKCGCPFSLKGVKLPNADEWILHVVKGVHNHADFENLEGHSYAGRLTERENNILEDMSHNMVKPKEILHVIKRKDPFNCTTLKTIYNTRAKYKTLKRAGRSQMQYLMGKLKEHGYFEWHRISNDTLIVEDLFWARPTSIDFLRTFPRVLIMDCTYKTNKYKIPLLEIVGVTSTSKTFCVAIVYLTAEREDNYTWALGRLKSIMLDSGVDLPSVVVTDRELALMAAVKEVFPRCTHLLCTWHIQNNILTKVKKTVKVDDSTNDITGEFLSAWSTLVSSKSEEIFQSNLKDFDNRFAQYPLLLCYVHDSWLTPYKERFVHAWTDKVIHFDNRTSNRAESAHNSLKKHLATSQSNFEAAWAKMHSLNELSFAELKASFEKSINTVQHTFNIGPFRQLRGIISVSALELIMDEIKRIKDVGLDASACNCVTRKIHGLPCAHEIALLGTNAEIPIDMIDIHWTRLHIILSGPPQEFDILPQVETYFHRFKEMDQTRQLQMYKKIRELFDPHTALIASPKKKVKTRGRPHKKTDTSTRRLPSAFELVNTQSSQQSQHSVNAPMGFTKLPKLPVSRAKKFKKTDTQLVNNVSYMDQMSVVLKSFIRNIVDVEADGNCGFRCVASLLKKGEYCWPQVRRELLKELVDHKEIYQIIFKEIGRVEGCMNLLSHFKGDALVKNWMQMPDIGYLIATCYQVVVFSISPSFSFTIPPLRGKPATQEPHSEIGIAFVNNNHFVQVALHPGHPVPPIIAAWFDARDNDASAWEHILGDRRTMYDKLVNNISQDSSQHNVVELL